MNKLFFFLVMVQLGEHANAQQLSIAATTKQSLQHSSSLADGIKWTEGLSWLEIKELAVRQKKYIFLDCFATWCTPCKMMDERVYINDSVGTFFNDHFINVKVQLDKTNNDNIDVKNWYNDATSIAKQYRIEAFPCFVFLSPEGKLVNQATGYTGSSQFISMAKIALAPGRKYEDPNAEYERLLADYRMGIVCFDRLYYMIQIARRVDPAIALQLSEKYEHYIATLNKKQQFSKDIIKYMADKVSSCKSNEFIFFKENEKVIDKVMNRKGYTATIIDKAIYKEDIVPFFVEQNKKTNLPMQGAYLYGTTPDYSEADWNKLEGILRNKFNKSIAIRNLLASRVEWYQRHWNAEFSCRFKLIQLKKYPPDFKYAAVEINSSAWNAFLHLSDKRILNGYIKWMGKLVQVRNYPSFIDTYANLLYKVGKRQKAIKWEEKAVEIGKGASDEYKIIVAQMKNGEPTHGVKF